MVRRLYTSGAVPSSSVRKLRIVAIPLASGASPERGVGSSPTACNFLFFFFCRSSQYYPNVWHVLKLVSSAPAHVSTESDATTQDEFWDQAIKATAAFALKERQQMAAWTERYDAASPEEKAAIRQERQAALAAARARGQRRNDRRLASSS